MSAGQVNVPLVSGRLEIVGEPGQPRDHPCQLFVAGCRPALHPTAMPDGSKPAVPDIPLLSMVSFLAVSRKSANVSFFGYGTPAVERVLVVVDAKGAAVLRDRPLLGVVLVESRYSSGWKAWVWMLSFCRYGFRSRLAPRPPYSCRMVLFRSGSGPGSWRP